MTNLVLLATVLITLYGFAHSYPSRTLNQPTNRLAPAAFTLPKRTDNQKGQDENRLGVKAEIITSNGIYEVGLSYDPREKIDQERIDTENDSINKESESIKTKKRNTWKSKIDKLNKWRLPRMENKNLPMVFILRTNEYEK